MNKKILKLIIFVFAVLLCAPLSGCAGKDVFTSYGYNEGITAVMGYDGDAYTATLDFLLPVSVGHDAEELCAYFYDAASYSFSVISHKDVVISGYQYFEQENIFLPAYIFFSINVLFDWSVGAAADYKEGFFFNDYGLSVLSPFLAQNSFAILYDIMHAGLEDLPPLETLIGEESLALTLLYPAYRRAVPANDGIIVAYNGEYYAEWYAKPQDLRDIDVYKYTFRSASVWGWYVLAIGVSALVIAAILLLAKNKSPTATNQNLNDTDTGAYEVFKGF